MIRPTIRVLIAATAILCGIFTNSPAALADAAGPTDYRTDIVSVEPATETIRLEMIGGDAFLSLEQLAPVEVVVLGYQAEPYLRFDADGIVYENRRSPAVWLNQDRYGSEDLPSLANAQARPEWFEVAANGRYTWHDHRSHWMNPKPPPSAVAGDQVLEATVPITVDGEPVTITVASYLLDSPSIFGPALAAAAAVAALGLVWRSSRVSRILVGLLMAGAAALVGAVAFNSVPTETLPSPLLWLLPTIAVVSTVIILLVHKRTATTVYLDGLAVAAGASLAGWAIVRFDALTRALIPSETPAGLDRAVIAAALVVGAALVLQGVWGLATPKRLHDPNTESLVRS